MALGAVGVQIGAGALNQRDIRIGHAVKLLISGDGRFVERGIEHAQPVQGAKLVVGDTSGRISVGPVELARVEAQNITGHRRMARQAILRTRIVPILRDDSGGISNEDGLSQAAGEKLGIAVIRQPFVGRSINRAVGVAHQKPGFQAARRYAGIGCIHHKVKALHENRSGLEGPLAGGSEPDLLSRGDGRGVVGHAQITRFQRVVRPQRRVGCVGN